MQLFLEQKIDLHHILRTGSTSIYFSYDSVGVVKA